MKTGLRSSGGVLHDVVKAMVARAAEGIGYDVELESRTYQDLRFNSFRPDVVLRWRDRRRADLYPEVFVEVQESVTKEWTMRMAEQYDGRKYVIIPLKNAPDNVLDLYTWVVDHVVAGSSRPVPIKHQRRQKHQCEYCLTKVIHLHQHLRTCKKNPNNKVK